MTDSQDPGCDRDYCDALSIAYADEPDPNDDDQTDDTTPEDEVSR